MLVKYQVQSDAVEALTHTALVASALVSCTTLEPCYLAWVLVALLLCIRLQALGVPTTGVA